MGLPALQVRQRVSGEQPIVPGGRWRVVTRDLGIKGIGEMRDHHVGQALTGWQLVARIGQLRRQVGGGDRHFGIGVGDVVFELFSAVHRVDRHHHGVGAQNPEMRDHQLRAVLHVEHHAVALLHPQTLQMRSDRFSPGFELGIGDARA